MEKQLDNNTPTGVHVPQIVWTWQDKKSTGAIGWVVFNTVINSVAGGGIFMHAEATLEETAAIAKNMTKKFTVTDPQIGGAKAGIRFPHTDPRAPEVLRRFILDHEMLLRNVWVTAGDLNTDDSFIEQVIQNDLGLPTCQSFLGAAIAKDRKQKDLSHSLAQILKHPGSPYFPLIEGAVGYGIAAAIQEAMSLIQSKSGKSLPKFRVMIQGFGAVGSSLAYYLQKLSIATVVGISDVMGFIHDPLGLDIEELLKTRSAKKALLLEKMASEEEINHCAKNLIYSLSDEQKAKYHFKARNPGLSSQEFFVDFLSSETAEIICPCATRYVVTDQVVSALIGSTWKNVDHRLLISGANNPYGVLQGTATIEDTEGKVLSRLRKESVVVIPDWVANSGTAQLFHRGLSVEFDLRSKNAASDILEACAAPIRAYIQQAFRVANGKAEDISDGCERVASDRIQSPIPIIPRSNRTEKSRYNLPPMNNPLEVEERYRRIMGVGEEIINPAELRSLLEKCPNPVAYDGFEPSGRMHIAQGLLKKIIVDNFTSSGFTYVFWIADWFALLNHKMDGDLAKIQTVGKYFIEVWKAAGMDMKRVKFLWASDEILSHANEYWGLVFDIATKNSLKRIKRCTQIMGREESDELAASQIFYPVMQCADIFFLGVDVCQLGMDQRKVNMLARDYAAAVHRESPIIVSHHMLMGLKEGQEKMSKSDPDSALFMEDSAEEVARKIKVAFCPPKQIEKNPCVNYMRHIVFPLSGGSVTLQRDEKFGGNMHFSSYDQFEAAYLEGKVHPGDLKSNLIRILNAALEPVREHFMNNTQARDLYEKVKIYRTTK